MSSLSSALYTVVLDNRIVNWGARTEQGAPSVKKLRGLGLSMVVSSVECRIYVDILRYFSREPKVGDVHRLFAGRASVQRRRFAGLEHHHRRRCASFRPIRARRPSPRAVVERRGASRANQKPHAFPKAERALEWRDRLPQPYCRPLGVAVFPFRANRRNPAHTFDE